MILKLEIFGAKFNVYFRQYQQGSPQKRLLKFGRSAGILIKNFQTQKLWWDPFKDS